MRSISTLGISVKTFFGLDALTLANPIPPAPPPPVTGPTFMVVGSDIVNPNTANTPYASWRDAAGAWHVIDTTAIGGRALLGVTHVSGTWYATSNAPGALNSVIGTTADGDPPHAFAATPTGLGDHLGAITYNTEFLIASLFGNLVIAPLNLSSFTRHSSHGPGSYVPQGVAINTGVTSFVCVGGGSSGTGICQSNDGVTWSNNLFNFTTPADSVVISDTLIWDGAQFVAVSGAVVVTSPDGLTWTSHPLNTTTATCVCYDAVNLQYFVGDQVGNTLSFGTIAGLATVAPVASGSTGSLRCVGTAGGTTIFGDNKGQVFTTLDAGVTFITENPGLGSVILNDLSGNI